MKKNFLVSLGFSIIISIIGLLMNYIGALLFKVAPLTIKFYGGEIIEHIGFGINFSEIFQLSLDSNTITKITFHPVSLIISILILFVILFLLKTIFSKKK